MTPNFLLQAQTPYFLCSSFPFCHLQLCVPPVVKTQAALKGAFLLSWVSIVLGHLCFGLPICVSYVIDLCCYRLAVVLLFEVKMRTIQTHLLVSSPLYS